MYRNLVPNVKPQQRPNKIYDKWWMQVWILVLITYVATVLVDTITGSDFNLQFFVWFLTAHSLVGILLKKGLDGNPPKR